MTIACVAGAERGGKRVEIIRESEQRARSSKRNGEGAPTTRPLFQAAFYFRQNRDWSELLNIPS